MRTVMRRTPLMVVLVSGPVRGRKRVPTAASAGGGPGLRHA